MTDFPFFKTSVHEEISVKLRVLMDQTQKLKLYILREDNYL